MSLVSPFQDASIAGCLASAALGAPPKPAPGEAATFACASRRAEAPVPQAPPRRARRVLDALFSLVSGPTMPQGFNRF